MISRGRDENATNFAKTVLRCFEFREGGFTCVCIQFDNGQV
jgi:hypothetical protein